jgi:hypothetical protein
MPGRLLASRRRSVAARSHNVPGQHWRKVRQIITEQLPPTAHQQAKAVTCALHELHPDATVLLHFDDPLQRLRLVTLVAHR